MVTYIIDDNTNNTNNTNIKTTVNIIPTAVNFTGIVPNGNLNWNNYKEIDDNSNPVNYLRGRKLVGKSHSIDGYNHIIFRKDDKENNVYKNIPNVVMSSSSSSTIVNNEIVQYSHQVPPTVENDQIERLDEWLQIANFINKIE